MWSYRNLTNQMQVLNLRSGETMRAMPRVLTPFQREEDRHSDEVAAKCAKRPREGEVVETVGKKDGE